MIASDPGQKSMKKLCAQLHRWVSPEFFLVPVLLIFHAVPLPIPEPHLHDEQMEDRCWSLVTGSSPYVQQHSAHQLY